MTINRIFFSLLFVAFTAPLFAQCSSSTKPAKAVKTSMSIENDIIDIAVSNDDFSTLVTAVKTAGLVSTLKSDGPFTVFAPVNAAFAKLPAGTVNTLLQPESKETLTKILTYHVVAGEFKAADVIKAIKSSDGKFSIKTVSGGTLIASIKDGAVILTDENGGMATVTATDIDASNGVIHIIDTVVLPK
jgi:uncharacterized surface protein with fasciclin (FAS1) repeats